MTLNIGNFYGTNVPVAPTKYAGMLNTQSHTALGGSGIFKPTFAQEAFMRYADRGVKLFPILDARAKRTETIERGFNIKSNWYPTLRVMQDVRPTNSKTVSTIMVDSTDGLRPNMMFVVPPVGELMLIRSIDSEVSISVVRGVGASRPTHIRAGTALQYSGVAYEEGSYRPLGVVTKHAEWTVHCMILRTGWALTNTAREAINKLGVQLFADGKESAMLEHVQALEAAMLFSQYGNNILNNQPLRTMAGAIDFIRHAAPQNIITVAGAVDKDDLDNVFDAACNVELTNSTNRSRICYCDSAFKRTVNQVGKLMENPFYSGITSETSTLTSTKYTQIETDKSSVSLEEHPLITRASAAGGSQVGMGLVLDLSQLELYYLGGRKTRVTYFNATPDGGFTATENDNGIDASGGTVTTECLIINKNPATSALIFNMTQASPPRNRSCLKVC